MKLFVVHVYLGCCSNNSDGKMWISADNAESALEVARRNTRQPIGEIEEFILYNEVVFSSFKTDLTYKLQGKTDNWGQFNFPYQDSPTSKRGSA